MVIVSDTVSGLLYGGTSVEVCIVDNVNGIVHGGGEESFSGGGEECAVDGFSTFLGCERCRCFLVFGGGLKFSNVP